MKTTIDLPRPLLLQAASRAARKRVPLSRFIAESLQHHLALETDTTKPAPPPDPLFEELRDELGL